MPLRGFLYFSRLYQKYLADIRTDLYHPSLIKIPAPKYYVLYNGSVEKEDRTILKLSDSFQKPVEEGTFEWTAIMLNINFGHNKQLMAACRILEEYSIFVDLVRKCQIEYPSIEEAISQAIDICIRRGVLSNFLIRHRGEVC